jgi:predicted nucleic acid-binding Zn ribbon protein
MAKKGRDHHLFKHRAFAGWNGYRYGTDAKPISLAGKPILKADARKAIVGRVVRLMKDWQLSPFEHEGNCCHGLRSRMCLDGHSWRRSNAEAAAIVGDAIKVLGYRRPTWEEGQRDAVNGTDYCSWCHGRLDEETTSRKQMFCSAECATMAVTHRQRKSTEYEGAVLRSARRLITKSKAPSKPCRYCGDTFQSDREDAEFCSNRCASRWQKGDLLLKDITCEGCGAVTKPANRGQKFCSLTCRSTTLWNRERERLASVVKQCQGCGSDFSPTSETSLFCSKRCGNLMRNRAYLERHRKPRAVHHFNCQCCGEGFSTHIPWAKFCSATCGSMVKRWDAGKVKWLTPPSFDYMLRREGARITDVRCEAA